MTCENSRAKLGIASGALVVGFVGPASARDKGIPELYEAYLLLREQFPGLKLLLVGDYERGDAVPREVRDRLERDAGVVRPGWVADPAPLLSGNGRASPANPSRRHRIGIP